MKLRPEDLRGEWDGLKAYLGTAQHLQQGHASHVMLFRAILDELEPDLVFTSPEDKKLWLLHSLSFRFAVDRWAKGIDTFFVAEHLGTLTALAEKTWRGPSGPSVARPMPFIQDASLKQIAERDYGSLVSMLKQGEWKAALVLAGCVIEAVLADALDQSPELQRTKTAEDVAAAKKTWGKFKAKEPASWHLHQMIEICGPPPGLDLLGERTVAAAHAVRDTRNLVHPREEAKTISADPVKESDASAADALVKLVLDDF